MPGSHHAEWRNSVHAPFHLAAKPRRAGLTMVIDKGLGLGAFQDLLTMGADLIDFVKLGFGTSLLYPPRVLAEKISLAKHYGVTIYPGGTLLEVAELQGTAVEFLARAFWLGFSTVEVSEGTISLSPARRSELIKIAVDHGLHVISEIGKKAKGAHLDPHMVHDQVAADLAAGAERIIVEGRDSGKGVGIYSNDGTIDEALVTQIVSGVPDQNVLIWEAPMVSQQQHLILQLGFDVNLGNVQPDDVVSLAATRAGLRGDTFKLAVEQKEAGMPEGQGPEGQGPEGQGPEGQGPEGQGPEGQDGGM